MGQPAAKQGDRITSTDIHLIQPPAPSSPVPVPHPHSSIINGALSTNVNIEGKPAAVVGSTSSNTPPHLPSGGSFVNAVLNRAEIIQGSLTVKINGKAATRSGDKAKTCDDPADMPIGTVVATSTVTIG